MDQRPLASLAFPVERARGRRYPELSHPYRNEFQRDRDRILHSRAFRRLLDKTQVFSSGLSDHFRNRLTHTLEVTQIVRTVAAMLGLNEDFSEALALVHDIGHPPFSHSGEAQLNQIMMRHGDHFDHNLHALRIVEWFEHRYARFPGLNLTFEVREGIVKHSRDFAPGEIPAVDEYLPGQRPPLEAQLVDLCDEAAYNTSDMDDAFAAGLLPLEELRSSVPRFGGIHDAISNMFAGADDQMVMNETVRAMVDWFVTELIQGTVACVRQAGVQSMDEVRLYPSRLIQFTAEAAETGQQIKAFLRKHVYRSEQVVTERQESMMRVERLFGHFMSHAESLPENYECEAVEYPRHRVVCDYIAGMTDGYFNRVYRQVFE